jgi:hypothetical protein
MLVIGGRDMEAGAVSVRLHGKGNIGAKPKAKSWRTLYRADLVPQATGGNIWRVGCRLMAAGVQSVSSVDADADTFRPITGHWKHSLLGEITTTYSAGQVQVQRVGKTQPETIPVEGAVYDNEEVVHAMRRLPLQVGYKTTMPVVAAPWPAEAVIPLGIEVQAKETVETPAGKFDCYKVHLNINQDFWYLG